MSSNITGKYFDNQRFWQQLVFGASVVAVISFILNIITISIVSILSNIDKPNHTYVMHFLLQRLGCAVSQILNQNQIFHTTLNIPSSRQSNIELRNLLITGKRNHCAQLKLFGAISALQSA